MESVSISFLAYLDLKYLLGQTRSTEAFRSAKLPSCQAAKLEVVMKVNVKLPPPKPKPNPNPNPIPIPVQNPTFISLPSPPLPSSAIGQPFQNKTKNSR